MNLFKLYHVNKNHLVTKIFILDFSKMLGHWTIDRTENNIRYIVRKDYDCWAVTFEKDGKELYRKDADKNEIKKVQKNGQLWREFQTTEHPNGWVVWPHSESKGWCERLTCKI